MVQIKLLSWETNTSPNCDVFGVCVSLYRGHHGTVSEGLCLSYKNTFPNSYVFEICMTLAQAMMALCYLELLNIWSWWPYKNKDPWDHMRPWQPYGYQGLIWSQGSLFSFYSLVSWYNLYPPPSYRRICGLSLMVPRSYGPMCGLFVFYDGHGYQGLGPSYTHSPIILRDLKIYYLATIGPLGGSMVVHVNRWRQLTEWSSIFFLPSRRFSI